jgi:hypothetical protein
LAKEKDMNTFFTGQLFFADEICQGGYLSSI